MSPLFHSSPPPSQVSGKSGMQASASSWQVAEQPSPSSLLPSSHSSPRTSCSTSSPQNSKRQSAAQPSPSAVPPSSHSSPALMTSSPQVPPPQETSTVYSPSSPT